VLLGAGAVGMGVFVWFLEADSTTLNAIADWLSPERISGWAFDLVLSAVGFVILAQRFVAPTRERRKIDADAPRS
jgi:hypothetical protein